MIYTNLSETQIKKAIQTKIYFNQIEKNQEKRFKNGIKKLVLDLKKKFNV